MWSFDYDFRLLDRPKKFKQMKSIYGKTKLCNSTSMASMLSSIIGSSKLPQLPTFGNVKNFRGT